MSAEEIRKLIEFAINKGSPSSKLGSAADENTQFTPKGEHVHSFDRL